ncbi:hypothetical protein KIN20_006980 [Parelaphostrongylus tenuis]|uniref:USP domain-containing protein n=1 Tax=Parelaphostrongylus tenuis TaxID=148309 RepID=A0AAD5QHF7_PARTN|nr:hypothetical protein KIN20_006980 [Parelaphostrongylus tenuis]
MCVDGVVVVRTLEVPEMSHKAQQPLFTPPVKSPPPAYSTKSATPLAVTFRETGGGPSVEEQCTIEHIRSFLGSSDFDEDLCLKAIRHPRLRSQRSNNEEEYLQEVVGVYMDELNNATKKEEQRSQTPRPVQGCLFEPTQTIEEVAAEMPQGSAGQVVPVSSTGSAAYTATPVHGLPSAAEERELCDIEKAIAESLISQGPSGNRSYAASLPSNPEELLRKDGESVGLHNTGNTCWFNVVAQLLFHLPRFRRIVYEHVSRRPPPIKKENSQKTEHSEVDLVEQMRYLFACMDLGNRRYIDPSEALKVVSALAARSKSDVILGRQQDASEMMSNLMEWMEKGLAAFPASESIIEHVDAKERSSSFGTSHSMEPAEVSSLPSEISSTSMDTDSEPQALSFQDINKNDQFLNDNSRRSHVDWIHALFHGFQVERARNDVTNSWSKLEYTSLFPVQVSHGNLHDALEAHQFLNDSGKEPWFESLPAVKTEKLNMMFHFPRTIFMDRYMASNYESIIAIREKRNLLRDELASVRAELKGLSEFPIGDRTDKIVNILKATLHFAKGQNLESEIMDEGTATIPLSWTVPVGKMQSFVQDKPPVTPVSSNLQHLSKFMGELENSIAELEQRQSQLCAREAELVKLIDEIYERDDLKRHRYQLHAVAIHEGHANAGHYWAYVRKGNNDAQWEKFNDQRVECAAWSDIETEAIGGARTTSAYFLLYVSSAAEPWLFSSDTPASSFLSDDIRKLVENENANLESEVERYRCTQNEDGKGNAADMYDAPGDDRSSGLSPAPPPLNELEQMFMLNSTPLERLQAVADPENLAVALKFYCEPWFTEAAFEIEKRKLYSLLEFNKATYPQGTTHELVIDTQTKLMYRNVLKPMLSALVGRAGGNIVSTSEIYNKTISNFYDEIDNVACASRSRPLRCLLDLWYTIGFHVPAKTARFSIVRALLHSESEVIVNTARVELDEFVSTPFADHYVVIFQHASHLYDLIKTLWSVVRQIVTDLIHNSAANLPRLSYKAIEANVKMLGSVRAVTRIYDRVNGEIGNFHGNGHQVHADFVMPDYIIRGINIIAVLDFFAAIVQFLVDRVAPRDDTVRLLKDSLMWIELVVHRLAIWARNGYKDAEKVIIHINETLNMISLVFQSSEAPFKREISRRIHGATQVDRRFDGPDQTFISQATDLCYEVDQAACQLSLLGLGDSAEADSVYTRMMAVVSDIINNAMQADERTSINVAFLAKEVWDSEEKSSVVS